MPRTAVIDLRFRCRGERKSAAAVHGPCSLEVYGERRSARPDHSPVDRTDSFELSSFLPHMTGSQYSIFNKKKVHEYFR